MSKLQFTKPTRNVCALAKPQCLNCHSQFREVRPKVTGAIVTRRFIKDFPDAKEAEGNVDAILECNNLDQQELHKFEENVGSNLIFRAKRNGVHMVYAVNKAMQIVFLRAFKNFGEYGRFLEDKKDLQQMLSQTTKQVISHN